MITNAQVHVWLPGQASPVVAGTFTHDANSASGRFQYAPAYLAAAHPALAPDMPVRARALVTSGGAAIFPLFLDAGPDAWGRHLLARRLEREVSAIEALTLCPTDGVGNLALGELAPQRTRILSIAEFLGILGELKAGSVATTDIEAQVLEATQNGTSLGGTKPKLTVTRDGTQYLAKFPERGDNRWLPHIECAMLKMARECGVNTCTAEVWSLPETKALLVTRFDREALPAGAGTGRHAYISAHALLRIDQKPPPADDALQYGPRGFTGSALRKSYVSLAADMAKWCGGQSVHREQRRELWRRIVFNALIRNLDDHSKNHGLVCHNMRQQRWRLAPAFDLVPAATTVQGAALAMAYRYVPPRHRGRVPAPARLVTLIRADDLLAAATEHYGYGLAEAKEQFALAANVVAQRWRPLMLAEGVPQAEADRFARTFDAARDLWAGASL